jgi:hypothetical protein
VTDAWAALQEAWGKAAAVHPFDQGLSGVVPGGPSCWDHELDLDHELELIFGKPTKET